MELYDLFKTKLGYPYQGQHRNIFNTNLYRHCFVSSYYSKHTHPKAGIPETIQKRPNTIIVLQLHFKINFIKPTL